MRRAPSFLDAVDEKQRNRPNRKSGHSPLLRSRLLLRRTVSRHPASSVLSFAILSVFVSVSLFFLQSLSRPLQVRNRKRAARRMTVLSLKPQKASVLAFTRCVCECMRVYTWLFYRTSRITFESLNMYAGGNRSFQSKFQDGGEVTKCNA